LNNPTANAAAIPNSDFAKIVLIVEPRIESATGWYLLGEGMERIEIGHLDINGISFESEKDFSTDSLSMNLKKSVELNPTENIQHKFDKPIGGMS